MVGGSLWGLRLLPLLKLVAMAEILLSVAYTINQIKSYYLNILHEHLVQRSLKSGGTNCHFKWVKVPGTTSY
jgi:hypothetical protein